MKCNLSCFITWDIWRDRAERMYNLWARDHTPFFTIFSQVKYKTKMPVDDLSVGQIVTTDGTW